MYRLLIILFLATIFLNGSCQTLKQKKEKKYTKNKSEINQTTNLTAILPKDYQSQLGKGIDVDWVKTSKGSQTYNKKMVSDFKKIGFSHVRIRVTENTEKDNLKHLENVVNDCLSENLIPIIAYQADFFKNDPTTENLNKVVDWWGAVATHFKNTSHKLSFDIIIEVTDALNKEPEILNQLYENAVTEIRKTNSNRIIFISPRMRSDPEYLPELKIPTKHNDFLMVETHFYAAGPSKTNPKKQWTTGTANEKKLVDQKIRQVLGWQTKNKILCWIGAWMPGDYADENSFTLDDQKSFAQYMTCQLTKNKIPFAINADHHFYDAKNNEWNEKRKTILETILQTNCE
jgi:hypothetical protein